MSSPTVDQGYRQLRDALTRFGRFRRRWVRLHGFARFLIWGPGALLLWVFLDWLLLMPAWPLLITFIVVAALHPWKAVTEVGIPLLKRVEPETEAREAERLHGELDNRLIGSLQLGRNAMGDGAALEPGAMTFVGFLLERTAAQLRDLRLEALIDLTEARRKLGFSLGVIAIWIGLGVGAPQALQERWDRLHEAYAVVWESLFPVTIEVKPGSVDLVRGTPIALKVHVKGGLRDEARLVIENLDEETTETKVLTLREGRAEHLIEAAMHSFKYTFTYGKRETSAHTVRVADLPDIVAINYEIAPPAYTGAPSYTLTGRLPKVRGLPGTEVLVSFKANTTLSAELSQARWRDGSRQNIQISGRFGHFSFTIQEQDRVAIHLVGEYGKGFEIRKPFAFDIDLLTDRTPVVRILAKKKSVTLLANQAAKIGFGWKAHDDFGVTEVSLRYRIEAIDEMLGRKPRDGGFTRVVEPVRDRVKGAFKSLFKDLEPPLQPGDRVTIRLTAKDNNIETGPGLGRSQPFEILIVRPDLEGFVDKDFGVGNLESELGLEELMKVKRTKDLLVDPPKNLRTEKERKIGRQKLKAQARQDSWPSKDQDATSRYFDALSRMGNP